MTTPVHEPSPQIYARIGGILYLIIIVIGLLGETLVRSALVVPSDAAATATNILSSEFLWRAGIAGELVLLICAVALTLIFYILLKPVNRNLALLAVFFNLIAIAVEASASLHLLQTLLPLGNAGYLTALEPEQRHALALLFARSHGFGFGLGLAFFGVECLLLGYLIFRSNYLPKLIGLLMVVAGLSYLVNSFTLILSPPLASALFPVVLIPAFVGETSLCLWLLTRGVNMKKWNEQVKAGHAALSGGLA